MCSYSCANSYVLTHMSLLMCSYSCVLTDAVLTHAFLLMRSYSCDLTHVLASCCRYLPEDTVTVVDPYAASSLRSSSRPLTPQVVPGGLRAAPPMTTAAAAKWAAAVLQGSFRPQSRSLLGRSTGSTLSSQGSGMSPMGFNVLPTEVSQQMISI